MSHKHSHAEKTRPRATEHQEGERPRPFPSAVTSEGTQQDQADMDSIRLAAYYRWENAGKPEGKCLKFWIESENDLAFLED